MTCKHTREKVSTPEGNNNKITALVWAASGGFEGSYSWDGFSLINLNLDVDDNDDGDGSNWTGVCWWKNIRQACELHMYRSPV